MEAGLEEDVVDVDDQHNNLWPKAAFLVNIPDCMGGIGDASALAWGRREGMGRENMVV